MTSALTAIGASDERPNRPAAPAILFGDASPLALAQVKVTGIVTMLEVLNGKVTKLETENTELRGKVEQLQDTVAEIQGPEPDGIDRLKVLRPNKSQKRVGLHSKY